MIHDEHESGFRTEQHDQEQAEASCKTGQRHFCHLCPLVFIHTHVEWSIKPATQIALTRVLGHAPIWKFLQHPTLTMIASRYVAIREQAWEKPSLERVTRGVSHEHSNHMWLKNIQQRR